MHSNPLPSKQIHIIGDFVIDDNFLIDYATVKIDPGVSIIMQPQTHLEISDSKLFSCDGLWQGIIMGNYSSIRTEENTVIEDAVNAIYSNAAYSTLEVENTTFNRDYVGIKLEVSPFSPHPPVIFSFLGNTFSCNAPLNQGATSNTTFAGLETINVPVALNPIATANPNEFNVFTKYLHYGIRATGTFSHVIGRNFIFENAGFSGIFIETGSLTLEESNFSNCARKAIYVENANTVDITDCNFEYNEDLGWNSGTLPNHYQGIVISSFLPNSRTKIYGNTFHVNFEQENRLIDGIQLYGGAVEGGTKIFVYDNIFIFRMHGSSCILLDGMFHDESTTEIFNNTFEFTDLSSLTGDEPSAILCSGGDKNNLSIYENIFRGIESNGQGRGIRLVGSAGINNNVSGNDFPVNYNFLFTREFRAGIHVTNFQNTIFCENTIGNSSISFLSTLSNLGTDLIGNTFIGGSIQLELSNSIIGSQSYIDPPSNTTTKGNKFLNKFENLFPNRFAQCSPKELAPLSVFVVNTDQSIENPNPPPFYTYHSDYHPSRIYPDDNDEWFTSDLSTTPSIGCIVQLENGSENEIYKTIANGSIKNYLSTPSTIWEAERFLYSTLARNQNWVNDISEYESFMNSHSNSNIKNFYEVNELIKKGMSIDSNINAQLILQQQNHQIYTDSLIIIDSILNTTTDSITYNQGKTAKYNLLNSIISIDSFITSLQTQYNELKNSYFTQALSLNSGIMPDSIWEKNQKIVYSIYLQAELNQNRIFTEQQQNDLIEIANQCPKLGGLAVYHARGLLSYCSKSHYNDDAPNCYPLPTSFGEEIVEGEPQFREDNFSNDSSIQIHPNPNSGKFEIILPPNNVGDYITIYDLSGQTIQKRKLQADVPLNNIKIELRERGVYFCVLMKDGNVIQSQKIIVK